MNEVPRRAFCGSLVAFLGAVSGCEYLPRNRPTGPWGADAGVEVVSDVDSLEAAFDDLSSGDTIRISARNAPYRTSRWLDIDVDGVTVVGPGVTDLITPADGADVGGIRVGHHERCRSVNIRGIGYHGNPDGQSDTAERLHGIAVRNAKNVLIEGNQIRETHPRKHGNGGSGVSVARRCSNVWVLNNRVHGYGDRGVQLGGRRLMAYGNVIANGLDRPIACDLWYPRAENHAAHSVLIFGNFLGNSAEGSLIGIARNTPDSWNDGYVSVFGNVGFGSHKSFCHIRGPKAIRNVSVQNNVSTQEVDHLETESPEFAGIAIDAAKGQNVTIKDNELYDYSGHGVHAYTDVRHITIQHNNISASGLAGIRLSGGRDGQIDGNVIARAGEVGVRLEGTSGVSVSDNYIWEPRTAGIVSEGSTSATGNDVTDNYISGGKRTSTRSVPAILVNDVGTRVRSNTIHWNGTPAIAEGENAAENLFENNLAEGDQPWRITAPTSRVRNNRPETDVHRGVSTRGQSGVVRVGFEKPYASRPRLTFGRVGGGIRGVSYETDGNGDYIGVEITVENDHATIDVFVDGV